MMPGAVCIHNPTLMRKDEHYMRRCFDLAKKGAGRVSPNPLVGAVLVHNDRIIGEGWHEQYGGAHAEVNALQSVRPEDRQWIDQSTLYVSLEPCCIFGKTPPCTNLILENHIPRVVISCLDQTPEVAGKGLQILREAGVRVQSGILEAEGKWLSRFRNTFVTLNRPYIVLKFAQTPTGWMGKRNQQIQITRPTTQRLVHKWRSETDAILVGTQTAKTDNPALTTRHYFGRSPLRIVLDRENALPADLQLFDGKAPTWVVNAQTESFFPEKNLRHVQIAFDDQLLPGLLDRMAKANLTSLLVEGGAKTIQTFVRQNLWDEARILTGRPVSSADIPAPRLNGKVRKQTQIGPDVLTIVSNDKSRALNIF